MADTLVAALTARPMPHDVEHLYLTDPIVDFGRIDGIMFSGGVGEYSTAREPRFRRHGPRLGAAIRGASRTARFRGRCCRPANASAPPRSAPPNIGCSSPAIPATSPMPGALLPRRNLQVLQPPFECGETSIRQARAAISAHHGASTSRTNARLRWRCAGRALPAYERLSAFAEGIRAASPTASQREPIFIMLDGDVAQTLGAYSARGVVRRSEILVIDGVMLWDFDYIDLGRIRMPSYTVPVTIKSLVFNEDPRGPRPRQRLHHHADDHEHDHAHGHEHGHHGHSHSHDHDHRTFTHMCMCAT